MTSLRQRWRDVSGRTRVNLTVGSVALLIFAYIVVVVSFGAASQVRYASNDFPGAKKAATVFLTLSPLERHIGYYNRGTAEAALGSFDAAQNDLEAALEIAPTRDECAVRINLAYVYEKQADEVADQDKKKASELYDQSLSTLRDAPAECQQDKDQEKQKNDEAQKRVEDKKNGDQSDKSENSDGSDGDGDKKKDSDSSAKDSGDGGKQDSQDEPKDPGEDKQNPDDGGQQSEADRKRDELRKRGEDAKRDQQQQDTGNNGGRATPDKPW